jgi:hypothetical protein
MTRRRSDRSDFLNRGTAQTTTDVLGHFRVRPCLHKRGHETIIEVLDKKGEVCGTIWPTAAGLRVRGFDFVVQIENPDGTDGAAISLANGADETPDNKQWQSLADAHGKDCDE